MYKRQASLSVVIVTATQCSQKHQNCNVARARAFRGRLRHRWKRSIPRRRRRIRWWHRRRRLIRRGGWRRRILHRRRRRRRRHILYRRCCRRRDGLRGWGRRDRWNGWRVTRCLQGSAAFLAKMLVREGPVSYTHLEQETLLYCITKHEGRPQGRPLRFSA